MWQIDQNEGNQLGLRSIVEKTLCLVLILFDYSVKLVFLNFEKFVVVNLKYLIQFFIKSGNQGHFQNLQAKLISKLSLVVSFEKELNELFKEKAYISESSR